MSRAVVEVRLEDLLGRRVRATNGRVIGRIEEIRAERRGDEHEVTQILIGPGALLERLAVANWVLSRQPRMRVARWDQIALDPVADARLTCAVADLREEPDGPGGRGEAGGSGESGGSGE